MRTYYASGFTLVLCIGFAAAPNNRVLILFGTMALCSLAMFAVMAHKDLKNNNGLQAPKLRRLPKVPSGPLPDWVVQSLLSKGFQVPTESAEAVTLLHSGQGGFLVELRYLPALNEGDTAMVDLRARLGGIDTGLYIYCSIANGKEIFYLFARNDTIVPTSSLPTDAWCAAATFHTFSPRTPQQQ